MEDAALGAARTLLVTRGLSGCTIAAVAQSAGVGKGTIYLRWPDKESLVLDAVAEGVGQIERPDTGSTRGDVLAVTEAVAARFRTQWGTLFAATMADLPRYPKLQELSDARVMKPITSVVASILSRGVTRGDVRAGLDASVVASLMVGPLLTRLLMNAGDIPKKVPAQVTDLVMAGLQP